MPYRRRAPRLPTGIRPRNRRPLPKMGRTKQRLSARCGCRLWRPVRRRTRGSAVMGCLVPGSLYPATHPTWSSGAPGFHHHPQDPSRPSRPAPTLPSTRPEAVFHDGPTLRTFGGLEWDGWLIVELDDTRVDVRRPLERTTLLTYASLSLYVHLLYLFRQHSTHQHCT